MTSTGATVTAPKSQRTRSAGIGAAGFVLMFGVGTMYGLSGLQTALTATHTVNAAAALLPFGAASAGLAVGSGISGPVLGRLGARGTAMLGALIWAAALIAAGGAFQASSLGGALGAFGAGGIGVGLTYLTLVATVGPAFPSQPLVGSAIGPLGFAFGTAALMLLAAIAFTGTSAAAIGTALVWAGIAVAALTLATGWGLPPRSTMAPSPIPTHEARTAASARRTLRLLLFGNAYPGMLFLAIVIPLIVSSSPRVDGAAAERIIAATTVALFLGGLVAPRLRDLLGARSTFTLLLTVRGIAVFALLFVPTLPAAIIVTALILFGHGAGFSILPGLMRTQDDPSRFARNYASVLISWGVAGAVGSVIAALSVAVTGGFTAALVSAGAVALFSAAALTMARRRTAAVMGETV
ncbi:OFA family MFS transporter [Curtobacterium pusillum]|uniref:OFA family MFS transporter n=1 Tax=Curtobacterium pusillum TaxID=69373 RepID=UPI0011AA96DA|nr:OFA family MFS transporter [Curtobacterium pusillum]